MSEVLSLSFEVACPQGHAFDTWTERVSMWWPRDHTVSGAADAEVILEPGVGGRIFERTGQGDEHDWGQVTVWDPPARLGYRWHFGRAAGTATDVDVRFVASGPQATRVEIEHRGWERLGSEAPMWRERNRMGWSTLLPHYVAAVEQAGRGAR